MTSAPHFSLNVGIAMICLAAGGCSVLAPPGVKVDKAMLDQIPAELPHRDDRRDIVLVYPPETAPVYDTKQMAYRTQPHEVAYFTQREWGETPAQMLHPLLVKTLDDTHAFDAVLIPPHTGRYTRALHTEILELIQDFTSQPATLVLTLRFQLTDYEMQQVIATKEISEHKPMSQSTSSAGVAAANEATAEALRRMADFVLGKTQ